MVYIFFSLAYPLWYWRKKRLQIFLTGDPLKRAGHETNTVHTPAHIIFIIIMHVCMRMHTHSPPVSNCT